MLEYNQDGLIIPSIGTTDTMVTGTVGTTTIDFNHQQSLLKDNQIKEEEMVILTTILSGVVVGVVLMLFVEPALNRFLQAKEEKEQKNNTK